MPPCLGRLCQTIVVGKRWLTIQSQNSHTVSTGTNRPCPTPFQPTADGNSEAIGPGTTTGKLLNVARTSQLLLSHLFLPLKLRPLQGLLFLAPLPPNQHIPAKTIYKARREQMQSQQYRKRMGRQLQTDNKPEQQGPNDDEGNKKGRTLEQS